MRIGAHVSIAKGLVSALDKAEKMGANCMQIFSSSPRSFNPPMVDPQIASQFKKEAEKRDIGPNFIHATYLINLGSGNPDLLFKSKASLIADMKFAVSIGAVGPIVHTGSHVGMGFETVVPTVVSSLNEILEKTPPESKLFLEIASGGKGKIGSNFEELAQLLTKVNSSRLGVYLDTCHMFAAGYGFDTEEKITELATTIENTVGWECVGGIHTNDSKGAFGSFIDRHENIGEGQIGKEPFKLLLADAHFSKLPFILETPGFDDKGPDKQNIDILKSLL